LTSAPASSTASTTGCPHKHLSAKHGVAALGIGPGSKTAANRVGIAGEHLGDRRLGLSRADGIPLEQAVERADRGHREREGHGDPREPLPQQAAEASAPVDQHREEAAQEKEQRHAKAVDSEKQEHQQAARLRVVHGPRGLEERQARVHGDAERHRATAQRVEVVAALAQGMAPAGLKCETHPHRLCCDRLPDF
jgi:hypothetical protein